MYVLDTNVVSHVLRYGEQSDIGRKVAATPLADLWITIITVEEMLRGRFASISNHGKPEHLPRLYAYLQQTYERLQLYPVLAFNEAALAAFQAIPTKIRQRAGTQDCRIAAIALAHDFTVITYNVNDFHLIPNLKIADWSQTIA